MMVKNAVSSLMMVLCMSFGIIHNTNAQDNNIVQYKVLQPESIKAGDSTGITIMLNIQPGWYIYAPSEINESQGAQIMQLKVTHWPATFSGKGSMILPSRKIHGSYQVFEGRDNVFRQRFVIDPGSDPGNYEIIAELKYQACSDRICYPPVTEKIVISVKVE